MGYVIRKSNLALADDIVDVRSEPLDDFFFSFLHNISKESKVLRQRVETIHYD